MHAAPRREPKHRRGARSRAGAVTSAGVGHVSRAPPPHPARLPRPPLGAPHRLPGALSARGSRLLLHAVLASQGARAAATREGDGPAGAKGRGGAVGSAGADRGRGGGERRCRVGRWGRRRGGHEMWQMKGWDRRGDNRLVRFLIDGP